jgi:hypothetical protein
MDDTHGLQPDRLVWMFTQMLRIREFEERVKRSFTELPGLLRGHTHLADGAEASIVGFGYLKAPIKQVTALGTPIPYSKPIEEYVLPDEAKIVTAVRQVLSPAPVT